MFEATEIPAAELSAVSEWAAQLVVELERVAELETQLKTAQETLRTIQEQHLPDALTLAGFQSFTMTSGDTVTLKTDYYPSITNKNKAAAFAWLRETKNDSIIKREIGARFGAGEDDHAGIVKRKLLDACGDEIEVYDEETVNANTLKAFVKDRILNEQELPKDLFGVHIITRAILKKGK